MLRHSILLAALLIPGVGIAQGIYNNGAKIVITSTSNIYIDGTTGGYRSESNGLIKNSTSGGTITLKGDWNNRAGNTGFEDSGETVVFASSLPQYIRGTSGTQFYKLKASGGGTKRDSAGTSISNLLTLENSTTYDSFGNTTLLATSTTNGQVDVIPSGSSVIGNTKVQVFFTGGQASYRGTRAVSAPIDETGLTEKTYKQLQNYMIITGPGGTLNGFDAGGNQAPNAITVTRYNEPATFSQSQFTSVASISEALPKGMGVFLFYRGDRTSPSSKVNQPFPVPENTTMQWNGPINQGDVTVNLSYTNNSGEATHNGNNLIGNPYPAYIDWSLVTKNNLDTEETIRIVKPGGGFATYTRVFVPSPGCNCYTDVVNNGDANMRYIAPGQAFYVKAIASNASVTFTESSKLVSSTPARYLYNNRESLLLGADFGKSTPARSLSLGSGLRMVKMGLEDATNKDEAILLFRENETEAATAKDISYLGGSSVSLSTISSDNVKLAINYLPLVNNTTEVKLSVGATVTGAVKLNMIDLSAVEENTVYLKDSYLNKVVDVKAEPVYNFYIDRSVASTFGDNRLSLIITPASTLPVALSGLKAVKTVSGAKLSWNVVSESNILKYEVERSTDAVGFSKITEVSGLGKNSYSVVDESPALSQNYYRVKIYDASGKIAYSSIASLDYSLNNEANVTVYPNPASDVVRVKLPAASAVKVSIIDLSGREIKAADYASTSLVQQNVSDISEGIYIIQVTDSKTHTILVKEKFGIKK